ncbi:hypothetical protein KZP23_11160 [Echinicola marina]|uniref:hypothetical protein n=1 Tax=Echinicola marina TaxID=2859768 RepID=UPI001CF715F9|nr:hypothetical protein [Echinicola marina]UCS95522.1 hypothetical protein KZP23_11160 [Echinicola marina]
MINVLVSYTVKPEFSKQNELNIRKFIRDFKELDSSRFTYNVFVKDDKVTFVHISSYQDEKMQQKVLSVPSFLEFQEKRDQSGLNGTHTVSIMDFVASAKPTI